MKCKPKETLGHKQKGMTIQELTLKCKLRTREMQQIDHKSKLCRRLTLKCKPNNDNKLTLKCKHKTHITRAYRRIDHKSRAV